jgi:hypothetical protein
VYSFLSSLYVLFGLQCLIFLLHFSFHSYISFNYFLIQIFVGGLRYSFPCSFVISFVVSCSLYLRSYLFLGVNSPLFNPMFFTYSTSIFAPSSPFSHTPSSVDILNESFKNIGNMLTLVANFASS